MQTCEENYVILGRIITLMGSTQLSGMRTLVLIRTHISEKKSEGLMFLYNKLFGVSKCGIYYVHVFVELLVLVFV